MQYKKGSYGYIANKDMQTATDIQTIAPNASTIYCQQALEKIFKYYLLCIGNDPDSAIMKKHTLKQLAREASIAELNPYILDLTDITDYYFNTRYPNDDYFDISIDVASNVLNKTKIIFEIVENSIEKYLTQEKLEYDIDDEDEHIL